MAACPRCGSALTAESPGGLCPGCLLLAGSETFASASFDELPTVTSMPDGPDVVGSEAPRLAPGQLWGAYRIGALLGRGGMGEVYEAEHTGSGRRVALKVLRGRLRPADRARFLREGQLAASVSHPHTVYIFGSEEIAGMPVITMELLPGGTLRDRVAAEGPLPVEAAVAAVLDIIGGLDAAQASGILHRDIKPSNCFIEHDGTVKVGDFGLSISTLARDVHAGVGSGGFEGTPQFAPPEQLRGEPLDVRADIYAVGATLYYLLTGRPPFEAPDLAALVARVTSEPAVPPRTYRPEIPAALDAVVLQCLAKPPGERPPSYAALAESLRPFAPGAHRPASPGIRFVAGAIDSAVLAIPTAAVGTWAGVGSAGGAAHPAGYLLMMAIQFVYYLLLEGLGGASLGKRLLGLRVLTATGQAAGIGRIALRTLVFQSGAILGGAPMAYGFQPAGSTGLSVQAVPLIVLALLFVTIRRRNGWAGLHELASRTRVVALRQAGQAHTRSASNADWLPVEQAGRRGPFAVGPPLRVSSEGTLRAGFDPQLRRPVWILDVPADIPIAEARRDAARPTRLRWLTGKRAGGECWDAFEAPPGIPLIARLDRPVPWAALKSLLLDLSSELAASERDGTLPPLGVDRLWLRDDGRLVVLDFPAPGSAGSDTPEALTPVGLIADVVRRARAADSSGAAPSAWPLGARSLFERLTSASPPLDAVRDDLVRASASLDGVTRWRRAIPAILATAPAVVLGVAGLAILPALAGISSPETMTMFGWLAELRRADGERRITDPADRLALERYVAGRYGATIADDAFWSGPLAAPLAERRKAGLDVVARHPDVTEEEVDRLAERLAPHRAAIETTALARTREFQHVSRIIVMALCAIALALAFACSLLSAIAVPGGLVSRLLGLAVVGRNGREIGRGRSVARVLVAWSPVLVWFAYLATAPRSDDWVPMPAFPLVSLTLLFVVMAAALAWQLAEPARGPHDRLMGTTVVPR